MRIHEVRSLSQEEIKKELEASYREALSVRFRLATRQLSDTSQSRKVRKKIARLKTIRRERERRALQRGTEAAARLGAGGWSACKTGHRREIMRRQGHLRGDIGGEDPAQTVAQCEVFGRRPSGAFEHYFVGGVKRYQNRIPQ